MNKPIKLKDKQTSVFKKYKNQIVLFVLAFVAYGNTINHGFVLDDDVVYVKNKFVQEGVSGIGAIFSHGFLYGFNQKNDQSYRPLVLFNFAIEHQLFGNNPRAHHFFGILFYAIACIVLYQFLLLAFQAQFHWLAFWISILFCLHPIHTEVVANIKGRDEILHFIFYISSMYFTLKYIDEKQQKKFLYFALITFFLALISKEMAVTLVGVLPISIYVFRNGHWKSHIKTYLLFAIPLVVYFILRNTILDTLAFEEKMTVINNTIAAANGLSERIGTTTYIFSEYIKLLLFPHPLSWDYSFPHFPIVGLSHPRVMLTLVSVCVMFVISFYILFKKQNVIAYGFLFLIITFSIVSNYFILIGSTLGERFLFLPSVGFLILLGFGIHSIISHSKLNSNKAKKTTMLVLSIIGLLYIVKTIDRNKDWKNNETLFQAGFEASPNNSRAVAAYASIFRAEAESNLNPQIKQSNFKEAIIWYKKSIDLYEDVADTWYNLGVCYNGLNQTEKAKNAYIKTLELENRHINAQNNLGVIYFQQKNYNEALKHFENCLKINNQFQNAYANLGAVYHNLGDLEKAKKYYQEALRLNPNDQNTFRNMQQL
ncbi:MAG: tetratricopeptide repeat protein [Bacteroidetes bacterium]|nr:MAG: tetratricopeptide repeat protein [Bacteroidota bacterium]MBL1145010.1 tetratricopeptide repeat protein [Bacteroidota bacterium]NOG57807.1 tetratricopeptide repeat protein [Bacteroidota bacterium]